MARGRADVPMPTSADAVEELNDRLAAEHPIDDYYARSPAPVRWIEARRLRIISDLVAASPGCRLLEVGCGGGHVLRMFPQARLTAVDVSGTVLAVARRNLAGYQVEFRKGALEELALPARSFDRIICTEVLEHTVDPEAILREMARLLAPHGRTVVTVPNDPLINRMKALVRGTGVGWVLGGRIDWGGDHYHFHQWTPREFHDVLTPHFRVVARRAAPFDSLPLRACFLCLPQPPHAAGGE